MAGSPIFSVNFTNWKNAAVLNYHKSWSWSKSLRVSSLLELKYTSTLSCRRYVETKKLFVQGNLNFALMYRNNIKFSVFVLCHLDCEIYWEYRTAGHLVFWKPGLAVEPKKVLSVTKHSFVFWAQRKPNTRYLRSIKHFRIAWHVHVLIDIW